jgi:uracil-DNA glycosylase
VIGPGTSGKEEHVTDSKAAEGKLGEIAEEVAACTRCELFRAATHGVPGEGSSNARLMFIGEGPGWHEDRQGRPFVGNSGKFLDTLIERAGLSRDDVFITNIVKHRPPGNRDPLPDEIAACSVYLDRQIEVIDPEVIVTLGRHSMNRYFPGERIGRIHGQPKTIGTRMVVPMYHPAAALHNGALRSTIEEDFRKLPRYLAEIETQRSKLQEAEQRPEQGTLF